MAKRVTSLDYYGYVEQPRCDTKDDGIGEIIEQQEKNTEKINEMEEVDEDVLEKLGNVEENMESVNGAMSSVTESMSSLEATMSALAKDFNTLKDIVAKSDPSVTYDIDSSNFSASKMTKNGTQKLVEDIDKSGSNIAFGIAANTTTVWNLNGHTLRIGRASYGGALVRGSVDLTIKGTGTMEGTAAMPLIWCAGANAVVNINGSAKTKFIANTTAECVYCESGVINISGGCFMASGVTADGFLLNCKDANYKSGTAKIIVTGGKFYGFDPKDNNAEGEHTSFMADGYTTVESTEVIDGIEYTVYTAKKA